MKISCQVESTQQMDGTQSYRQNWSYVMCPPDHFSVLYEINPWMNRDVQPDLDVAREQWYTLVSNMEQAGASVQLIEPDASLPDMVFTADVGFVDGQRFIMSRFRYQERQREARIGADWFSDRMYEVIEPLLDREASFESSDLLPFRNCLIGGYGFRTAFSTHATLAHLLQRNVCSVRLINPCLYHLDVCFCPLDDRHAMVVPAAWNRRDCERIKQLVPEPLELELDEALTFCANSLVIGKTIIMPHCPVRVGRILEKWGFTICVSSVSEFIKAGGAVHCLTLALNAPFNERK